jgi:DNA-binding LacI/PurR family transcriptional regulator
LSEPISHILDLLLIDEEGNPTFETGQRLGGQLLQLEQRPTAAFCVNDAVAMGVLDSVSRAGLIVPHDLSLVGFDDVVGAASLNPPLTTVRVFKQQLGELAVRYLENLITVRADGGDASTIVPTSDELEEIRTKRRVHNIHVPVELVVRSSTTALVRDDA